MINNLPAQKTALNTLNNNDDISFFFTKKHTLLERYFKIREQCYRLVPNGPKDFKGGIDHHDERSDILVIMHKNEVVGGVRIVGRSPSDQISLPMEEENFQLNSVFFSYNLKEKGYCEFSRLAILKEYRSMELLNRVCGALIHKTVERDYSYLFAFTPLIQARTYKQVAFNLNLPNEYKIHPQISVPQKNKTEIGRLKMYVSSLLLPSSQNIFKTSPLVHSSDIRLRKAV